MLTQTRRSQERSLLMKEFLAQRLDASRDLYLLALALGERGPHQFSKLIQEARLHFIYVIEEARIAGLDTLDIQNLLARQGIDLVLATGYYDHVNRLGVPGEDLPHVRHYFDEPHLSYGLDVVVIGGKNSAVEAALQLFRAGARTTIIYRGTSWPKSVKYWLRPDLENRIKAGEIQARLGSQVVEITPRDVLVRGALGNEERSEEHTSELQSRQYLVCRLLLEKKKKNIKESSNSNGHKIITYHRSQTRTPR